jgi:AraC-like DNA-binding protein
VVDRVSHTTIARCDSATLSTLIRLIGIAQSALPDDTEQAARCMTAARALLQSEKFPQTNAPTRPLAALARWQLNRVVQFIDANLSQPIHVQDLASLARLSTSHFSNAFRRTTGECPFGFLRRHRIERAQQLILLTDRTLADIALECGLADQAHLTRLFRRMVGMNPGAWRRLRGVRDDIDQAARSQ